ncbi:hypothetical protein H696_05358 [Fonticula alba]|uniref:Anaphase-promoting complex subunit 4 WD40 domain-containing protein n=1 Tax=Fonticula alba TaxID=691883 RepID=A0A058Z1H1_FONAL|nr:hypothetical protein H696_05358 [Fonticula alba]KCV68105.1 hypothetical protein H696_05358 [Fonticula alba]|eukprot:XP_009497479.1 hypothetical protein H696_05358 [Fonticula alba]
MDAPMRVGPRAFNDSEDDEDSWSLDHEINDAHTNWVRDVAFSQRLIPTASGSDALSLVLASCSQDRTVVIHSRPVASLAAAAGATPVATWTNVRLPGPRATATADATDATPPKEGLWPAAVWRVSWSPSGVILAVSDATGGVTLWSPTAGESSIAGLVWEEIAQ